MRALSPSGERGSLERLCGDEAELERSLAEARRAAAGVVAAARGEAERIVGEVRAKLAEELASYRAETEALVASEGARATTAADEEAQELGRRAARNRPRALARLLEIVLGRGLP